MRMRMDLTVGMMLLTAALASAAPIDASITSMGFQNPTSSTWSGSGTTADGRLQFGWGSQPNPWNQNWRPTIDCPALCATVNLGLQLANPLIGLIDATYDGVAYSLGPNAAGDRITSFVLTIAGSPAVAGVFAQDINVPGDYTMSTATYTEIVPFAASITLHNGTLGTDVTIDMTGTVKATGNALYVTRTSTGARLFWEQGLVLSAAPATSSPEASTMAMWMVGGAAMAVARFGRRR